MKSKWNKLYVWQPICTISKNAGPLAFFLKKKKLKALFLLGKFVWLKSSSSKFCFHKVIKRAYVSVWLGTNHCLFLMFLHKTLQSTSHRGHGRVHFCMENYGNSGENLVLEIQRDDKKLSDSSVTAQRTGEWHENLQIVYKVKVRKQHRNFGKDAQNLSKLPRPVLTAVFRNGWVKWKWKGWTAQHLGETRRVGGGTFCREYFEQEFLAWC